MTLAEMLETLTGRENTEVYEYPKGAKLCMCTAQNIPKELLNRKILKTELQPRTYLGIAFYLA